MRRDVIFYQLFKRFPSLFFALIGQPAEQARGYRFESVEVKEPNFRIDGVFLPPETAATKIIFFTEVQFQKDELLYHRFFAELLLYLYRNPEPYDDWYGVLIFPSRSLEPEVATLHRALLNSSQVQAVYLDELDDSDQQPPGIRLMQLIVAPENRAIAQAQQLLADANQLALGELSQQEIMEAITTIIAYKFTNLSREEVEAMLGTTIQQTRIYQEAFAEGKQAGTQEGRQEGRQEGEIQGKLAAVPLLVKAGMSLEDIARQLSLDLEDVRQTAHPNS